jgi:hypothetical protein
MAMTGFGFLMKAYDSTAAYGGTIFWKLNPLFLKVTHGWEYK